MKKEIKINVKNEKKFDIADMKKAFQILYEKDTFKDIDPIEWQKNNVMNGKLLQQF